MRYLLKSYHIDIAMSMPLVSASRRMWAGSREGSGDKTRPPLCTAVCGALGSRGSALAFFYTAGAEPRVPRGLDLGGLFLGVL